MYLYVYMYIYIYVHMYTYIYMYICLYLNGGLEIRVQNMHIYTQIYQLADKYGLIINGLWSFNQWFHNLIIRADMKLYFSKLSFSFRSDVCCTACQAPGLWYVKFTDDYISALICTVSKPSTTLLLPYANPSLDTFDRVSIPEVIPCPSLCV